MRRAVDKRGPKVIHRSGHPEFVELVAEDPLLFLERGQRLFAEGDVPTCMYIVKTGQLLFQIDQLDTQCVVVQESASHRCSVLQDNADKPVLGQHLFIWRHYGAL